MRRFGKIARKIDVVLGAPNLIGKIIKARTPRWPRGDRARVITIEFNALDLRFDSRPELVQTIHDLLSRLVERDHVVVLSRITVNQEREDFCRSILLRVAVIN